MAAWSIGVNVAFELAQRHPERVAGLMAVAGVPGGTFATMGGPLRVPRRLRRPLSTRVARAARSDDLPLVRAQLRAVEGAFAPGLRLDRGILERWARFSAGIHIVDRVPDVARAFDFTLTPSASGAG